MEKEEEEPSLGSALLQSLTGSGDSGSLLNTLLGSALGALTGKKEN